MAFKNPNINYCIEADSIRKTYVESSPAARYRIIQERLNSNETGAVRLLTLVSAVEALTRSILVHSTVNSSDCINQRYEFYKLVAPENLIQKLCT